jgi:site-specific recombinase XerD
MITNVNNSTKTGNKKTSSLSINLRPRENQRGVTLYFRLNLNRTDVKPTDVSLGIKCQKSEIKKGKIKGKPEVDLLISTYKANIERAYYRLLEKGQPIDLEILKYAFKGNFIDGNPPVTIPPTTVQSKIPLLFEAMDIYVQSKYFDEGTQMVEITKLKARRYFNHLKQWAKRSFGREDVELSEIKSVDANEIVKFMIAVRGSGHNHATMHVQRFKSFYDFAIDNEWIAKNPFMNYKRKVENKEIIALDKKQLTALENLDLDLNSTSDLVRDLFVFSCYTGLAYGDLHEVSFEHIKVNEDGEKYILKQRMKNDKPAIIPLLDTKPIEIIEKYRRDEFQDKIFTVPTNQFMNDTLKSLATLARIKVNLTTHIARKTCGTLLVEKGVEMSIVQRVLGHSSINTTIGFYAKHSPESVINAVNKNRKNS